MFVMNILSAIMVSWQREEEEQEAKNKSFPLKSTNFILILLREIWEKSNNSERKKLIKEIEKWKQKIFKFIKLIKIID